MPAIQPASVLLIPQTAMKVGVSAAKAKLGSSVPISPIDMANTSGRPRSAIMRLSRSSFPHSRESGNDERE